MCRYDALLKCPNGQKVVHSDIETDLQPTHHAAGVATAPSGHHDEAARTTGAGARPDVQELSLPVWVMCSAADA
jgi:hypothetical protein